MSKIALMTLKFRALEEARDKKKVDTNPHIQFGPETVRTNLEFPVHSFDQEVATLAAN